MVYTGVIFKITVEVNHKTQRDFQPPWRRAAPQNFTQTSIQQWEHSLATQTAD